MPHPKLHHVDGRNHGSRERDATGTVLANYREARAAAIQYAGDVLSHEPEHLWSDSDFRIEVTDETGLILFTVIMLAVDAPATGRPREGDRPNHTA